MKEWGIACHQTNCLQLLAAPAIRSLAQLAVQLTGAVGLVGLLVFTLVVQELVANLLTLAHKTAVSSDSFDNCGTFSS